MRNIIVTGASRGIGLAIAKRLVHSGYKVLGVARTMSDQFQAAQAEFASQGEAGTMELLTFDLSDTGSIRAFVSDTRKAHGKVYGLVNNAALGTDGLLAMMDDGKIEELLRVNVQAPIMLTKYVARHMMADGEGRIVNVGSIIGFTGYSGLSVYGATKSAMLGFTRSFAREVGRVGVTVNAIAPGFMATEMTSALGDGDREQIARRAALKRLATPEDVAGAIEFLVGPTGRNITGTVLTVDAGATA
ncbi:MAG: SDR family NAD(P)-dependent oxidoreductase [Pseudolabrys sp.]|jgi:3-oxoacyl-[acyl-carrier protein] reductase